MLRKSQRLWDRSASANTDTEENGDPGGGIMETNPFVDAGSAAPIVLEVIPVENGMDDGVVASNTTAGEGDVVVAEVDVAVEEEEEEVVEWGG